MPCAAPAGEEFFPRIFGVSLFSFLGEREDEERRREFRIQVCCCIFAVRAVCLSSRAGGAGEREGVAEKKQGVRCLERKSWKDWIEVKREQEQESDEEKRRKTLNHLFSRLNFKIAFFSSIYSYSSSSSSSSRVLLNPPTTTTLALRLPIAAVARRAAAGAASQRGSGSSGSGRRSAAMFGSVAAVEALRKRPLCLLLLLQRSPSPLQRR